MLPLKAFPPYVRTLSGDQRVGRRLLVLLVLLWTPAAGAGEPPAAGVDPGAQVFSAFPEQVLDLESAQRLVLRANPNLKAAAERIRQARDAVRQTDEAYWPELRPEGTSRLQKDPLVDGARAIEPAPLEADNFLRARLKAQWTLFDGMKRDFDAAAARFGERQSRAAADEARRLLLTVVAERYYDAQLALEEKVIAEEHLAAIQRQGRQVRARSVLRKSKAGEEILLAAEARDARTALLRAEETLGMAMAILEALTGPLGSGEPPRSAVARLASETAQDMVLPDQKILAESAERFRPDLQEARYALQRLEAATGAARVDFAPDFKVRGTLEGDLRRDQLPSMEELGGSLGLFMEIPVFEGDTRRERLVKVRNDRQAAEKMLVTLRQEIQGEVLAAAALVRDAQERLRARAAQADLALQERDRAERELAADLSLAALRQMITAWRDLTASRQGLALARATLRQAWMRLDGATGRILLPFEERKG